MSTNEYTIVEAALFAQKFMKIFNKTDGNNNGGPCHSD